MDLDADGHLDVLSGSYPGELYLFRGRPDGGFEAADALVDGAGAPINLGSAAAPYAVDWDADGDVDLVVGDIYGNVWLLANESGDGTLAFAEEAEPVVGGDEAPGVPGGDAGPTVVDWDGDGTLDLIVGCGDGGVRFYPNAAKGGPPSLGDFELLVEAPEGGMQADAGAAPRLGARVKPHVVDWNGDGKLDLLLGDLLVASRDRSLSAAQRQEAGRLSQRLAWVTDRFTEALERLYAAAMRKLGVELEADEDVWDALEALPPGQTVEFMDELGAMAEQDVEFLALQRLMERIQEALEPLQPDSHIHGHVWVLLRR